MLRLVTAEERGLVGLKVGTSGSCFSIFSVEVCSVALKTLTIHIGWYNVALDTLESLSNGILCSNWTLSATVEEFSSVKIILRGSI